MCKAIERAAGRERHQHVDREERHGGHFEARGERERAPGDGGDVLVSNDLRDDANDAADVEKEQRDGHEAWTPEPDYVEEGGKNARADGEEGGGGEEEGERKRGGTGKRG